MIIALILLGLTAICCVCAVSVLAVGGFFTYRVVTSTEIAPLLTYEVPPLLTEFFATETPTPKPDIVLTPLPPPLPGAGDTLETLQDAVIPGSDLREIATRLQGIPDIPATVSDQPANHAAGDRVETREVLFTPAIHFDPMEGFATTIVAFTTDIPSFDGAWGKPFLLGPGNIHVAHTSEERVPKLELAEATRIYQRLVRHLLAVHGNSAAAATVRQP